MLIVLVGSVMSTDTVGIFLCLSSLSSVFSYLHPVALVDPEEGLSRLGLVFLVETAFGVLGLPSLLTETLAFSLGLHF